jgi:hypothetical protein
LLEYFPDESARGLLARWSVLAVPLLYLAATLIYSAHMVPWGQQVDPESAYAMNGLAAAIGYPFMKTDHPGTTTILLVDIIIRAWAFFARPQDVAEFGLTNYNTVIYVARTAETLILTGVLVLAGNIVRNVTRSSLAAAMFQVGPFVHFDTFHFEMVLIPESLMVCCAIFGMALAVKVALDAKPPTVGLGAAAGLTFALGLSSKYLHLALATIGFGLVRNPRANVVAILTAVFGFFIFNRVLHPWIFSNGFHWLVSLATHKGEYGHGEPGFVDFATFWPNMGEIISSAPLVSAVFAFGAFVAVMQMAKSRRYLDPVSVTLLGAVLAFLLQLVATAKHFALHYMMASWVLTGGVLVLSIVETRRLAPQISSCLMSGAGLLICAALISTTLFDTWRAAVQQMALDQFGSKLSMAIVKAAPACANVSGMFVRDPENELNHGGDMTFGNKEMEDRFSDAYTRGHQLPLLDQKVQGDLYRNFHRYSYKQLAADYPCIVVRSSVSDGFPDDFVKLNPDHCTVNWVHIYTVGIACQDIQRAAQTDVAP